MFHSKLPRFFELRELVQPPAEIHNSIFSDFENSLDTTPEKYAAFLAWENELQKVDESPWADLKQEASPYLMRDKKGRGWEPLFNILNQALAYGYLKNDLGCSRLQFIKRSTGKTPDLQGHLNGIDVLCEVKTINISKEEVTARKDSADGKFEAKQTQNQLKDPFFKKLLLTIEVAKKQIKAYGKQDHPRGIAFFVVNFDDFYSEYKEDYYFQIDQYLSQNPVSEIEVVFFNKRTIIHKRITMASATVVNQP